MTSPGHRTKAWRQEKMHLASIRTQGVTQNKVLAHLIKHTDHMLQLEMKDIEQQNRADTVRKRRTQSLLHKKSSGTGVQALKSPAKLPECEIRWQADAAAAAAADAPLPPTPLSSSRHASPHSRPSTGRSHHSRHDRVRHLCPNLPLAFISQPQLTDDRSFSSEQSRALGLYQKHALKTPHLRFHLLYTDSFAENRPPRAQTTEDNADIAIGFPEHLDMMASEDRLQLSSWDAVDHDAYTEELAQRLSTSMTLRIPTSKKATASPSRSSYDSKATVDHLMFCSDVVEASATPRSAKGSGRRK